MAKTTIITRDGERCSILGLIWTCEKEATRELLQAITDDFKRCRTGYDPDKDYSAAILAIEMLGGGEIVWHDDSIEREPADRVY